jgi:hypothetical protein
LLSGGGTAPNTPIRSPSRVEDSRFHGS